MNLSTVIKFQANKQVSIPKEHHRWILGKQGQRLKDLEKTTATKIQIPSVQEQSDIITITGTKEGIEKAEHEIKVISDEQVDFFFAFMLNKKKEMITISSVNDILNGTFL